MNKQKLIEKMMKNRLWHKLTCIEQSIYYELINIYISRKRKSVFSCTNAYLCRVLNISEPTLSRGRKRLINCGLIFYQPGKYNRTASSYSFTKPFAKVITTKKGLVVTTKRKSVVTTQGDLDLLGNNIYITPPNPLWRLLLIHILCC